MNGDWKQRREGGTRFSMRLICGIARHGGRGVARLCLYPITTYFLLRRPAERHDSRAYLSRVFGRPATLLEVWRHVHTFASTTLDRIFMLGGQMDRFAISVSGLPGLHAQLDQGRGVLLFGSHLGSFEALRVLARERPDYKIRVLLDKAHNPAMTELLDALNPEIAAGVIDASQDGPGLMLAVKQAADEGALITFLVDRAHTGGPTQTVDFMDAPARFPVSPWQVAAVLRLPISLAFGLYRGGNRYDLVFESFSDDGIELPRRQRTPLLAALIQRYAARLEHHARDAPFNWFNFYDFWNTDDATLPAPGDSGADAVPVPGVHDTASQRGHAGRAGHDRPAGERTGG